MLKKILLSSLFAVTSITTAYATEEINEAERLAGSCQGSWRLTCSTPATCSNFSSTQRGYVSDNGCSVHWGPHQSIGCSNPGYRAVTVGKSGDDRYTEWYFSYTNRGRCPVKAVVHTPGQKVSVFKVLIQ
ncbi:hypothetical protein [Spartinivicinus poritis]|uniref:Uncharacterized protein n=1 Tax=Spartinivicinus poritis TaxID=2994640 RepID=A0ABT5UBF2_9GAMM|nr:hypothetical protein [Spartinivicinus sp. A2-2]MDE1463652.1 hypothetical protein [Spartinivicinus sp. A2-2]